MSNGNGKTQLQRTPVEWVNLMNITIEKIEEDGYPKKLFIPEVIRLLVHYRPAREHLNKAIEEVMKGFYGVEKLNPEVEKWMKGR